MKLDGPRVKRLREDKGWSQTKLGSKCRPRVSVVTICKAEAGNDVYPDTAARICAALEIAIEEVRLPVEGDDAA